MFERNGKFNLCLTGADRFGGALNALAGERTGGREIAIRRLTDVSASGSHRCHLLFVGGGALPAAIASERGLLTIGEARGFVERGGVINLVETRGRIRFEINRQAAERAGLAVSSRLLDLAVRPS